MQIVGSIAAQSQGEAQKRLPEHTRCLREHQSDALSLTPSSACLRSRLWLAQRIPLPVACTRLMASARSSRLYSLFCTTLFPGHLTRRSTIGFALHIQTKKPFGLTTRCFVFLRGHCLRLVLIWALIQIPCCLADPPSTPNRSSRLSPYLVFL